VTRASHTKESSSLLKGAIALPKGARLEHEVARKKALAFYGESLHSVIALYTGTSIAQTPVDRQANDLSISECSVPLNLMAGHNK
jgi:hypothetical protein